MALKEPVERDWLSDTIRQTGANLRATDDTALAGRLRAQGLAEVLQAPQRGKPPPSGRTKYILKLYPNADAPRVATKSHVLKRPSARGVKRIPWYLLLLFAQAAAGEWSKQRSTISKQLDEEIESLEAQLRSTKDRSEKKRLADALQTALHADENLDAEINKRVYARLANSHEPYAEYVNAVDWLARR
jgi:hypothetical protein